MDIVGCDNGKRNPGYDDSSTACGSRIVDVIVVNHGSPTSHYLNPDCSPCNGGKILNRYPSP
jgi:hypothetical protein